MSDSEKENYRERAERELVERLEKFRALLNSDISDGNAPERKALSNKNTETANRKTPRAEKLAPKHVHFGHRSRMREAATRDSKLIGFRDVEILEFLLSFFVPRRDTNPLAHRLLDKFGSVTDVLRADYSRLAEEPSLPKVAARLLPTLFTLCYTDCEMPVGITNHFDAVSFFGSAYLGGMGDGTYAVCLNSSGKIVGMERCDLKKEIISPKRVFNAACKYESKSVLLIRRERGIYPDAFSLSEKIERLVFGLLEVGIRLMDFIMFTDYGYYTLGTPPKGEGWYAQYIFVPIKMNIGAPELLDIIADGGKLPDNENK